MSDTEMHKANAKSRSRQVYDRDFKLSAVHQVAHGIPAVQVARELNVSSGMVARWLQEVRGDPVNAFRGNGRRTPTEETLARLRRENRRLKEKQALLKKISARFASNPNKPSSSLQSIERYGRLDGCARYSMSRQADITTG